jgi:hypothetical protein
MFLLFRVQYLHTHHDSITRDDVMPATPTASSLLPPMADAFDNAIDGNAIFCFVCFVRAHCVFSAVSIDANGI